MRAGHAQHQQGLLHPPSPSPFRKREGDTLAWLTAPPYPGIIWVAWVYVVTCCLAMGGGPFAGRLAWFDDNVRMVQVLDWLNHPSGLIGGWHDRMITRVDPPLGFHTIWSRLVDLPLAAIILPLQNFIGQHRAALTASILLPLIQTLLLFFATGYAAAPLVGRRHANLVTLFVLFTSCLNIEHFTLAGFELGAAGHHAWYVLLTVTLFGAMARLLRRQQASTIWLGGLCLSGLIAIGIEGLPLIAGACISFGLASIWSRNPALPRAMALMAGLGAIIGLCLLPANQPPSQWLILSLVEPSLLGPLLLIGAAALFTTQDLMMRRRLPPRVTLTVLGAVAALMLIALLHIFPELRAGGAAGLSPAERQLALAEHAEAMSLWRVATGWLDYIRMVMPSVMAIGGGVYLAAQATIRKRRLLLFMTGLAATGLILASIYSRYFHYAQLTACPLLLACWLAACKRLAPNDPHRVKRFWLYLALGPLCFLLIPALDQNLPLTSHLLLFPAKRQAEVETCDLTSIASWIDAVLPPQTLILTPLYDSDKFLFQTQLREMFLASFPSQDRFIDAKRFYDTHDPAEAAAIAAAHQLDAVAVCTERYPALPKGALTERLLKPRLSFGQQLAAGTVPNWLTPLDPHVASPYRLFLVKK